MTDVTAQVMKDKKLPRTYHSKERMDLAEVLTLAAQRLNVLSHLCTLRAKMSSFKARVTEDVEDGLSAFCQKLAASLSDISAAWQ